MFCHLVSERRFFVPCVASKFAVCYCLFILCIIAQCLCCTGYYWKTSSWTGTQAGDTEIWIAQIVAECIPNGQTNHGKCTHLLSSTRLSVHIHVSLRHLPFCLVSWSLFLSIPSLASLFSSVPVYLLLCPSTGAKVPSWWRSSCLRKSFIVGSLGQRLTWCARFHAHTTLSVTEVLLLLQHVNGTVFRGEFKRLPKTCLFH